MATPQTNACVSNGNLELLLSWTPGIQLVTVQIQIKEIPNSASAVLSSFETVQVNGSCNPMTDANAYRTKFQYTVPVMESEEPVHMETYLYEISCRAHDVHVEIINGTGGTTSNASAKAILN